MNMMEVRIWLSNTREAIECIPSLEDETFPKEIDIDQEARLLRVTWNLGMALDDVFTLLEELVEADL